MSLTVAFAVGFRSIVTFVEHPPALRCEGDEDVATQGLRRPALSRALTVQSDLVVELRALSFADASFMLDLVMLSRRLRKAGRRMRIRGAQPQIHRLIETMGVQRLPGVELEPAPVGA